MHNRIRQALPLAASFLLVFVASFLLRAWDDNSLFSWSWAFALTNASSLYLLLAVGLVISLLLSGTAVPDRAQVLFLMVVTFAAVVPLWRESEIIIDASRYFTQAKHLELYGTGYFLKEWGRSIFAWTDMPLVPLLYGFIFRAFGEHRIAIQVFTTALFSLTAIFTFLIGSKLWDRETGFTAGLLLLGIPFLLTQVPLMLVDVPVMFFLTASVYAFLDALDHRGGWRICFAVAAIVCAALAKYSAGILLSVLMVALAISPRDRYKVRIRRGLITLATAAVLCGAAILVNHEVVASQIALLTGYQKQGLSRWGESFASTFLFQVHPFITASALFSIIAAIRKRDLNFLIVLWLPLLAVVFGVRRIRYVLPVFPMLTLMAARGLRCFKDEFSRRFVSYGIVAWSLVIAVFAYLPLARNMSSENIKHAGEYLDSLPGGVVEVIVAPARDSVANPAISVPLLDLFTSKSLHFDYRRADFIPPEDVQVSSLRFTWLYRNPAYYSEKNDALCSGPAILLSSASSSTFPATPVPTLPACYSFVKSFRMNDGIFRYSVAVHVFHN